MYSLVRITPVRKLFVSEAPGLAASLLIAKRYYKFHSFTLEAIAFLATWCFLSFVLNGLLRAAEGRRARALQ